MSELIPVLLAFIFGGVVWRTVKGLTRIFLSVAVVLAAGLAATLLSGEFRESWLFLLVDVAEAAAGLVCAVAAGKFIRRSGAASASKVAEASPLNFTGTFTGYETARKP
jgi:hypothetical protein